MVQELPGHWSVIKHILWQILAPSVVNVNCPYFLISPSQFTAWLTQTPTLPSVSRPRFVTGWSYSYFLEKSEVFSDSFLFCSDIKKYLNVVEIRRVSHVGDKVVVAPLTMSDPLIHPFSPSAWTYIAFLLHVPTTESKSDMFSLSKLLKDLEDQFKGMFWTLNEEHFRARQRKH